MTTLTATAYESCTELKVSNQTAAQQILKIHHTHTCAAWIAATAYVSAGIGDYE